MPERDIIHAKRMPQNPQAGVSEIVTRLDALLRRALVALGQAGEADCACRLAAAAWSTLRRDLPREAEVYTGLLHRLTATKHPRRRNPS